MFVCSGCGAELTAEVEQVALPAHAGGHSGYDVMPPSLEPKTYAVIPEPSGWPWRRWADIENADEVAEARGIFAPVGSLSFAAPGAVLIGPGDAVGTVLIPDRCDGSCCGLDGRDGPNLACTQCGRPVATLTDDCGYWREARFEADAVRRLGGDTEPADEGKDEDWDAVGDGHLADPAGTGPIRQERHDRWCPRWEMAAGSMLAHIAAASGGRPVDVPDGLLAAMFRRTLARLLPAPGSRQAYRRDVKRLAVVGPGRPADVPGAGKGAAVIALVPRHPRTGRTWQPPTRTGLHATVPVDTEIWRFLAFAPPVPATWRSARGTVRDGVERDHPLPQRPAYPFRPYEDPFLATLARLPQVREPWLRARYDRLRQRRTFEALGLLDDFALTP
ncbi:hypothetical protein [Yinghuangia soli]|uniref:Uncharacterized protein n=1 Tax=Yinghuangia soli TaxID=2908204 RepID=A0AA41Q5U9_9ACTN|nr:hypothetical protein [Yinghuangia soli]MCF2530712.1 hypothetical protein [Yinghuangia soli]